MNGKKLFFVIAALSLVFATFVFVSCAQPLKSLKDIGIHFKNL